jgi:signal peptidase II
MTRSKLLLGLAMAALVLALDQATKYGIMAFFAASPEGGSAELAPLLKGICLSRPLPEAVFGDANFIDVLPVFKLVGWCNFGVSFGMLSEHGTAARVFLVCLSLAVSAGLLVWMRRAQDRWTALALGLVVGGALGNVLDRLYLGAVFDFLYFHLGDHYFPAFNVADSGITVGVALLAAHAFFVAPPEKASKLGPASQAEEQR